ncbi:DNA/RNA non-specific endonuclease [Alkalimarinus coralli]|uniref:DNA/RNA non-specific endonuclease n=1 Tax=Alkalimarinus coralli TaxID=2935863 RepID=UPI00202AD35B|nr:DNA/RNA non-specific endonuclease [Alkalimarinus coralli]
MGTLYSKGSTTFNYLYGPDDARFYQRKDANGELSETIYIGGGIYEEETVAGVTTLKSYVGDFLIDKREGETVTQTYTLRDHLGSVDTVVDDDVTDDLQASVIERSFFAPFGERVEDARAGTTLDPVTDDRGFTDHEHMDEVGLIHMNGRVYDPVIGRFLSADPYVQAPYFSQSYNRYSYGWNNPLSGVDPTGYEWWNPFSWDWSGESAALVNIETVGTTNYGSDDFFNPTYPETEQNYEIVADAMVEFGNDYLEKGVIPTMEMLDPRELAQSYVEDGVSAVFIAAAKKNPYVKIGERVYDNLFSGSIDYGKLDELSRPTGVSATITPDMIGTGSPASRSIIPPGWSGNGTLNNEARGHLLGNQLGGSGKIPENIVTLQQNWTNSPVMRDFESSVANVVKQGEVANYLALPIYKGNNLVPRGITIQAEGSKGFSLGVTILNPPGM